MPSAAIGAGISAVGSVAGGVASGKGAKAAAKIQAQTAANQLAATQKYQADNEARYQPEITSGNNALSMYDDAIGTGTDPNAAATALSTFQGSTGYKTTLANALSATNASAYAAGLGKSGGALAALQDRGANVAQQSYQGWLGNLQPPIAAGSNAKAALAGVSGTALAASNAATSNAGNASSTAALATGASTSNALNQLGQLASNAYTSSYTPNYGSLLAAGNQQPIAVYNNPDYSEG